MTAAAGAPDAGRKAKEAAARVHPQMLLRDREEEPTQGRYLKALGAVPDRFFKPSTRAALLRLAQTVVFVSLAIHALSIAPAWALPVCWVFAGFAFIFLFEVGHDCSSNNFFGSKALNDLIGCLSLAPLVQPAIFWSRHAEEARANRDLFPVTESAEADAPRKRAAGEEEEDEDAAGAEQPGAAQGPRQRKGHKGKRKKKQTQQQQQQQTQQQQQQQQGETEDDDVRPARKDWVAQACGWASRGWHVSHVVVLAFVLGFLPYVGARFGAWAVVKFWLVPFALFHLYMGQFVKQGTRLTLDLGEYLPRGWLVDWQLRSYLRFHLAVPSYRLPEAADRVKRMWERQALDGAEGPSEPIERLEDVPRLHDSFHLGSFLRGWSQLRLVDSTMSLLLRVGVALWLYLLWTQRTPDTVERFLAHPYVTLARRAAADAVEHRMPVVAGTALVGLALAARRYFREREVYLVDFVTYTAPKELEVPVDVFRRMQRNCSFNDESLAFMDRLIERTGLGQKTYLPPGCHQNPPELTFARAREEAEMVMFGVLDKLFASTGTRPGDIDVLIVNCSLFNPTPSLAGMIINRYKMREDIESYNLSGMGCSAHVIAVHLAKDLVRAKPGSRAVVISTENITMNWYHGAERSMLVSNTLFRVGGGACLFSSRPADRSRSKYRLLHTVRTHRGADDASYRAVFQEEDSAGTLGVRLSKDLMRVAGEALKHNITTLGPLVLPLHEQLRYIFSIFRRKVLRHTIKTYVPRFQTAIDHFCVHAGGRAVIDAIQEALRLNDEDVAASRATLHRYGNVSSSSVLYELAYLERHGRITRGDKIWLVAFGSGFSANSAVYEAL